MTTMDEEFQDFIDFDSYKNPEVTKMILLHSRLKTFNNWPFDKIEGSKCNSYELAKTGFVMTSNDISAPSARCICCLKHLMWEAEDVPQDEHIRIMPFCALANILAKKKEVNMTVRDVMHILAMREVTNGITSQLNRDVEMIRSAVKYNDDFVKKAMKKL
uniref:Saposin B-type domain-containing protein n=1 Tax=Parastrongyloides trichosuri TaxID=131310 RepID=A0A0N4ZT53_PARTI